MNIPAPPNSPMALGRVIDNKLNPLRCINKNDSIKIPADAIYEDVKTDWYHDAEDQNSGRHSVWARFIYGWLFGGGSGASFDNSIIGNYVVTRLETSFFEPDDDYIRDTMFAPSLETFLEASRYRKPVYLITGLKVARGIRARSRESRGTEGHAAADAAPAMAMGAPRTIGGEIGGSSRQLVADRFEGSTDIVIGYRLRKIICDSNMEIEHDEETSGTILGIEDDIPRGLRSYKVKTIAGEDAVADESDVMEMVLAVDDVDQKECRCFIILK
jgi:hypothetical protein